MHKRLVLSDNEDVPLMDVIRGWIQIVDTVRNRHRQYSHVILASNLISLAVNAVNLSWIVVVFVCSVSSSSRVLVFPVAIVVAAISAIVVAAISAALIIVINRCSSRDRCNIRVAVVRIVISDSRRLSAAKKAQPRIL